MVCRVNDLVNSCENRLRGRLKELEVFITQIDKVLQVSMTGLYEFEAPANLAGYSAIVCDEMYA